MLKVFKLVGLGLGIWLGFAIWVSLSESSALLTTLLIMGTGLLSSWAVGVGYLWAERVISNRNG